MTTEMILRLAWPLLATIVIEFGVLLLLGETRRRVLLSSVVVNVLTNVPLNLCLLFVDDSLGSLCWGEALVVLVEAAWYWLFVREVERAVVYSVLCNAISLLLGLLILIMCGSVPAG